jgi:ribosome biogenesis protein BMS1
MDPGDDQRHKTHNTPHSGRKADKKRGKELTKEEEKERKRNPKAFAIQSVVKAERRFRHKQDKLEKKYHIPVVDRTPTDPPPIVVGVVGPAKVGKSTLIRNMVKHFTGQTVHEIKGPITVIAGKNKRFTFIECNNDINNMIDLAKVADMSLLLVDASFGFEMETFEYLNICKAHGEHRIMGVLTHLDQFNKYSKMKKAKKELRKRFWTEVYAGAKLFYLSRIAAGKEYVKLEIRNLARFMTVMKLQPVPFRTLHPYVLVDRFEDLTNPDEIRLNERCDRNVVMYGYTRGAFMKPNQAVHLAGCGDMIVDGISFLPDPCPLPEKKKKDEATKKRQILSQKDKLVYAPFSGIGGILYDQDAVYIDLGTSHFHKEKPLNPVFDEMNKQQQTMESKILQSSVRLFDNDEAMDNATVERDEDDTKDDEEEEENADDQFDEEDLSEGDLSEGDFKDEEDDDDEDDDEAVESEDEKEDADIQQRRRLYANQSDHEEDEKGHYSFDDDSDADEKEEEGILDSTKTSLKWKDDLAKKAAESYYKFQETTEDVQKLVYGEAFELKDENELDEEKGDGLLRFYSFKTDEEKPKEKPQYKFTLNNTECTQFVLEQPQNWEDTDILQRIRDCFVTGKWSNDENAEMILRDDEQEMENFGDFDDLENDGDDGADAGEEDDEDEDMDDDEDMEEGSDDEMEKKAQRERLDKKKHLKEEFDMKYDTKAEEPKDETDDKKDPEESRFYREIKEKLARQAQVSGVDEHRQFMY